MKLRHAAVFGLGFLSLLLGGASAWPIADKRAGALALAHFVFLFVALVLFFFIFPRRMGLPVQIFVGMVLGVLAGWALPKVGDGTFVRDYLGIFGVLFILLLKLVIIPLIFVSIVCGMAGVGDLRKLGSLGTKTLLYFLFTTSVAVLIGLTMVNTIRPGVGRGSLLAQVQPEAIGEGQGEAGRSLGSRIQDDLLPAIIQNPIMAAQNPLVIIVFALFLGAALASLAREGEPAVRVFQALDKALIQLVLWIMVLAPVGVFALMARAISELGLDYVLTLATYCATVLIGLVVHFCFLAFVLCPVLGKISPLRFLRGMTPAFEVAFTTSSSSATLPVTIECAAKRVGANENVCNFVLPIGATINMDGTALYVAVASLFVAQVYGINLGLQAQLMVFLTAIAVSVGAAGIPGASIGLMSIIFAAAGIPMEGIGIVLGVDRILDMSRTVVNVTGDSVGAVVVSRSEGLMGASVTEPRGTGSLRNDPP